VIATGSGKPASLCRYARPWPINTFCRDNGGSSGGGYWACAVRLCNSEVHSASALSSGLHRLLPDSLAAALKRTRPRQRRSI